MKRQACRTQLIEISVYCNSVSDRFSIIPTNHYASRTCLSDTLLAYAKSVCSFFFFFKNLWRFLTASLRC